jgi:hypothetical protein
MEQFNKPLYANMSSFDRNVSKTGSSKKGIDKGYRWPAQWAALSKNEKDKILSVSLGLKEEQGKKARRARSQMVIRESSKQSLQKATEAISAIMNDTDATCTDGDSNRTASESSSGNSLGDQFGRKAHETKRIIQSVVTTAKGGKKSEQQ